MQTQEQSVTTGTRGFPEILPLRQRSEVIHRILKKRLDTILPMAMRDAGNRIRHVADPVPGR